MLKESHKDYVVEKFQLEPERKAEQVCYILYFYTHTLPL